MGVTIRRLLSDNPRFLDYTICLSQVFVYDRDQPEDKQLNVVTDFPILGVGANDSDKELRFIILPKDKLELDRARDHCIHVIDQKMTENDDGTGGKVG